MTKDELLNAIKIANKNNQGFRFAWKNWYECEYYHDDIECYYSPNRKEVETHTTHYREYHDYSIKEFLKEYLDDLHEFQFCKN